MKNEQIKKKGGRSAKPTALLLIYSVLFFTPIFLLAQIEITEIMYNPGKDAFGSKADGGREWIEIYNSGPGIRDLTGWKLVNNKGGHPFEVFQGDIILESGEYLVVADVDDEDDNSTFLTDWPDFSGTILNSNFSLLNTADTLILKNSDSKDISQVLYTSVPEAYDTGNSFQKISERNWGACSPTPGAPTASDCTLPISGIVAVENFSEEEPPETSQTQPEKPVLTSTTPVSATTYKTELQIFASIIPPVDTPIAGADFFFEATAFGFEKEPLQNAKYQWSFGDGAKAEGQKVLYAFAYPGEYLVSVEVISGEYSVSDRLKIKVIPSDIVISEVGTAFDNNFIELNNPSNYELNLSWWRLRVDNNYWTFPKNTILLPKTRIKLSSRTTNLFPQKNNLIQLLYPNGMLSFAYMETSGGDLGSFEKTPQIAPNTTANLPVKIPDKTTQVATIQNAILPAISKNELPKENIIEPASEETKVQEKISETTKNFLEEKPDKFNPLNKWNFMLVGITVTAIGGVLFATKLDN